VNVSIPGRFEKGAGIGAIGLAARDVRADSMRRKENDAMSEGLELACPVVRRSACLEQDGEGLSLCEKA
jgi:hypothetical protein